MIKAYYAFNNIIPEEFLRQVWEADNMHTFLGEISTVDNDGGMIVCVNSDTFETLDYWLEDWDNHKVKV